MSITSSQNSNNSSDFDSLINKLKELSKKLDMLNSLKNTRGRSRSVKDLGIRR